MSTRTWFVGIVIGALAVAPAIRAMGAEHGGKEHAGKEHGGQEQGGLSAAPAAQAGTTKAPATTQEHGGQEHGGQAAAPASPTPAMPAMQPSAEQIRQAIRDYIAGIEKEEGAFTLEDDVTGDIRTLTLVQVHERVGKTGDAYYSCTDMKDAAGGEVLDLDFDVADEDGALEVVDVRIHKVNGQPRYTYDDQDNRIPLM